LIDALADNEDYRRTKPQPEGRRVVNMIEKPPCTITPDILTLIEQIVEAIGQAEAARVSQDLRLRRINRIRTIRGSLAIGGNTLSEAQIAAIFDGRKNANQ